MDINAFKPDFEKMSLIYSYPPGRELHINSYNRQWEDIVNGLIPYPFEHKSELISLLEEYSLSDHFNEFLFLGNQKVRLFEPDEASEIEYQNSIIHESELLHSLNILFNISDDVKIEFKSKKKKGTVSITNKDLISVIKDALHKEYMDYCVNDDFIQDGLKVSDITDWGILYKILVSKLPKPKKGRKEKNESLELVVATIKSYLQHATILKANEGNLISRKQGSFIFKFLSIFKLISEDKRIWCEDNIRLMLTTYYRKNEELEKRRGLESDLENLLEADAIKLLMNKDYVVSPLNLKIYEIMNRMIKIQKEIEAIETTGLINNIESSEEDITTETLRLAMVLQDILVEFQDLASEYKNSENK